MSPASETSTVSSIILTRQLGAYLMRLQNLPYRTLLGGRKKGSTTLKRTGNPLQPRHRIGAKITSVSKSTAEGKGGAGAEKQADCGAPPERVVRQPARIGRRPHGGIGSRRVQGGWLLKQALWRLAPCMRCGVVCHTKER